MKKWLNIIGGLGFIICGIASSTVGPSLPFIKDALGLGFSSLSLIISFRFSGYLVSVAATGVISDRAGKTRVLIASGVLLSLGLACFGRLSSREIVFPLAFLLGCGSGSLDGALNSAYADLNRDKRSFALNVLHMFFGVGAICGPLIFARVVATGWSWRSAFMIGAGFAAIFCLFVIASKAGYKGHLSRRGSISGFRGLRTILTGPVLITAAVLLLCNGVEASIGGLVCTYLVVVRGWAKSQAPLALSTFWVSIAGGRLLFAFLVDRFGYHRIMIGASLGVILSVSAFLWAVRPATIFMTLALAGVFFSGMYPSAVAQAVARKSSASGSVTGLMMSMGGLGGLIAPAAVGSWSQKFGMLSGMRLLLPVLAALLLVLASDACLAKRPGWSESS